MKIYVLIYKLMNYNIDADINIIVNNKKEKFTIICDDSEKYKATEVNLRVTQVKEEVEG